MTLSDHWEIAKASIVPTNLKAPGTRRELQQDKLDT